MEQIVLTEIARLTESPGPMQKLNGANYHPGEQIISHLNYALGPGGWDWIPLDHGYDEMADEVWVMGQLTARIVVESPNGEQIQTTSKIERGWKAVNRRRNDNSLVSLGDDYKGADTDALKRAARLLGVGLDAWEKEGTATAQQPRPAAKPRTTTPVKMTPEGNAAARLTGAPPASDALLCSICEAELHEVKFKDGTVWQASDLAGYGRQKHEAVLCMNHYREANQARREAEIARATAAG